MYCMNTMGGLTAISLIFPVSATGADSIPTAEIALLRKDLAAIRKEADRNFNAAKGEAENLEGEQPIRALVSESVAANGPDVRVRIGVDACSTSCEERRGKAAPQHGVL
jgi:hypothetical protein